MNKEDKSLLLQDLSARLPYGVKAFANTYKGNKIGKVITITTKFIDYSNGDVILGELYTDDECFWLDCRSFKPYLRPMSSMTEEEKVKLSQYACIGEDLNGEFIDEVQRKDCAAYIDWLIAHHFDFRNLIEKGLALEAPEGMYNLKEK